MTYNITLKKRFWGSKTLKDVKGHMFLSKNNPAGGVVCVPDGLMMIIFKDESRMFINANDFQEIHFSDGWFKLEVELAEKASNGQVNIKAAS